MFSGAVLAGGRSSRFGSDKARHVYQGKALASWVLDSLESAHERFIVANTSYPEFGVNVYPDLAKVQSPLTGIHSALTHAKREWVAVAACDLPFLIPAYWAKLLAYREDAQAVVVARPGGLEPLAALYHKDLAPLIAQRLQQDERAVHSFLTSLEVHFIPWEKLNLPPRTLTNVNTEADLM